MADKYEVTMMYRVHMPEGTEDMLQAEFGDDAPKAVDEVLTELISEAQTYHVDKIAGHTGKSNSNWVYLEAVPEQWSAGWYNTDKLPEGWEGATLDILARLVLQRGNHVRALIVGVEVGFMSWIWEGEE